MNNWQCWFSWHDDRDDNVKRRQHFAYVNNEISDDHREKDEGGDGNDNDDDNADDNDKGRRAATTCPVHQSKSLPTPSDMTSVLN